MTACSETRVNDCVERSLFISVPVGIVLSQTCVIMERQKNQLLEPTSGIGKYVVSFGERDLLLEPLTRLERELLDQSNLDYGNAWDFTKLGYTGEPIFATISPRHVINTSIPLLDQK